MDHPQSNPVAEMIAGARDAWIGMHPRHRQELSALADAMHSQVTQAISRSPHVINPSALQEASRAIDRHPTLRKLPLPLVYEILDWRSQVFGALQGGQLPWQALPGLRPASPAPHPKVDAALGHLEGCGTSLAWPGLRKDDAPLTAYDLHTLLGSPLIPARAEEVNLSGLHLGPVDPTRDDASQSWLAVLLSRPLPHVGELKLWNTGLTPGAAALLAARGGLLPELYKLDVSHNPLGDVGTSYLTQTPWPRLRDLIAREVGMTRQGAQWLRDNHHAGHLPELMELDVSENFLGDRGLAALLNMKPGKMTSLVAAQIGATSSPALEDSRLAAKLRHLDLKRNPLGTMTGFATLIRGRMASKKLHIEL